MGPKFRLLLLDQNKPHCHAYSIARWNGMVWFCYFMQLVHSLSLQPHGTRRVLNPNSLPNQSLSLVHNPLPKNKTKNLDNYHRISHKLLLIINHNNKDMLAMKTRLCLHWCRQIVVHVLLQLKWQGVDE